MSTTNETAPAVANLRQTKREMAASKRRHPAGSKAAPAKASATGKPAEKPAETAEKAARKTPKQSGQPKLRWSPVEDPKTGKADPKTSPLVAVTADATYSVLPDKSGGWQAVLNHAGKTTVLIDGTSRTRAYYACTDHHHYGKLPEVKKSAKKEAS
jgi:hypothetical protein